MGKVADMLVLSEQRWEHLVYQVTFTFPVFFLVIPSLSGLILALNFNSLQLGSRDVIKHVVKKGTIVV